MAESKDKAAAQHQSPAAATKAPAGEAAARTTPARDQHVPDPADPAAVRLAEAVQAAQRKELIEKYERAAERIGSDPGTMPLAALRALVGALESAVARLGIARPGFVSAGVAADLERAGYSVDPANGDVYLRDADSGRVTRIERRTGVESAVDMPEPQDLTGGARQSVKVEG
jgi:hypothetical protein